MKIAIPSMDGSGMESAVCEHFGQAPFFTIVDTEIGEAIAQVSQGHQDGKTPAQRIAEVGAEVVIGGGMGGQAIQLLGNLGIEVFLEARGTVQQALKAYRQNALPAASEAGACTTEECPDPNH